jgi:hypothetical protein
VRVVDGPHVLNQACRCPCCRRRVTWAKAVWSGAYQARCLICGVAMTFDLALTGLFTTQATVGAVMNDWARVVEHPRLRNDRCACRT